MSIFRTFPFLLFMLAFQLLRAQPPLRKEIEIDNLQTQYLIMPMAEKGVFVAYASSDDGKSNENIWHFEFYNTWFSLISADSLNLPYLYNLHSAHADSLNILMLFTSAGTIQEKEIFYLVKYNINSQGAFMAPLSLNYSWSPDWVWVDNEQTFIGGKHSIPAIAGFTQFLFNLTSVPYFTGASVFKLSPVLLGFNYEKPFLKTLHSSAFRKNTWIEPPLKSPSEEKYLFPLPGIHKKKASLDILEFQSQDSLQTFARISAPERIQFSHAQLCFDNNGQLSTSGTWMSRKGSAANPSLQGFELSSKGLFYGQITAKEQSELQFLPFANFSHYYYFFEKPKLKRASRKTEKLRKDNKLPNYHFDIILDKTFFDKENNLVFHGETIYLNYVQPPRNPDSEKIPTITQGYRHNHSFMTLINPVDFSFWDMSLNTNGVSSPSKKMRSASLLSSEDALLMYNENGLINARFQSLKNGRSSYQIDLTLPSLYAHDKATHESNQGVYHWYDNVFMAHGVMLIFNSQMKDKRRRTVIYISKFAVE